MCKTYPNQGVGILVLNMSLFRLACCAALFMVLWSGASAYGQTFKDNPEILRLTTSVGLESDNYGFVLDKTATPTEEATVTRPVVCFEAAYENVEITCTSMATRGPGVRLKITSMEHRSHAGFSIYPALNWHNPGHVRNSYNVFDDTQKREGTLVPGLYGEARANFLYLQGDVWSEIFGKSGGNFGRAVLGMRSKLGQAVFKLGGGIKFMSKDYANYHYGVMPEEATAARPAYAPGVAFNPILSTEMYYQFSNAFSIKSQLQYMKLSQNLRDSPVIVDDSETRVMVFLQYSVYFARRDRV